MRNRVLVALIGLVLARPALAQESFATSMRSQEQLSAGKEIFLNRCAGCHGIEGNGKGPASAFLNPKPRDFTSGIFKFKTTPLGALPTDADLMKTVRQGVPGTSMPSFRLMPETERQAVVAYIQTLSKGDWAKRSDVAPLVLSHPATIFTDKDQFIKTASNGRVWFQELGCVQCHGNAAIGNGPQAETMVDSWQNPIRPADLSKRYVKRGATVEDIATSVALGVDGTPMPAFWDVVPDKKVVWELAAYILYRRGEAAGLYPTPPIAAIPDSKIPQDEVDRVMKPYEQASAPATNP